MPERVADLFVRCLAAEGVTHVFGIPGEETLDLNDALEASPGVTFVPVRHEQGAAFIADAYGRLTGRAGVCLATLGPGATNLATGVADAFLDRAPLVALTGQASVDRMHKESHQFVDVVRMFAPITKWNARLAEPATTAEVVRKAFALAEEEKPGATHLELPEDVMGAPAAGDPMPRRAPPGKEALPADVQRAARLLANAERPVVLAGNGVIRAGASDALRRFARSTGVPVITTFMGKGALAMDDPRFLFTAGLAARNYSEGFLGDVDLMICAGYDLVEWSPSAWNPHGDKTVICIDTVPAEIDAAYNPDVQLIGDLEGSLLSLALEAPDSSWAAPPFGRMLMDVLARDAGDPSFPLRPQRVMWELQEAIGPHDVVISDVGAHKLWLARMFPAREPNTVLISNGFAAMGFALPAAIAARLVLPREHKVIAVMGDGGFLMNVQELETAHRLGLGFLVLVWSDSAYGVIEWHQERAFGEGRIAGTRFGNPDIVALARSFGCDGVRVESAESLGGILRSALVAPGITVVEVPIDYRDNPKLALSLAELTGTPAR